METESSQVIPLEDINGKILIDKDLNQNPNQNLAKYGLDQSNVIEIPGLNEYVFALKRIPPEIISKIGIDLTSLEKALQLGGFGHFSLTDIAKESRPQTVQAVEKNGEVTLSFNENRQPQNDSLIDTHYGFKSAYAGKVDITLDGRRMATDIETTVQAWCKELNREVKKVLKSETTKNLLTPSIEEIVAHGTIIGIATMFKTPAPVIYTLMTIFSNAIAKLTSMSDPETNFCPSVINIGGVQLDRAILAQIYLSRLKIFVEMN